MPANPQLLEKPPASEPTGERCLTLRGLSWERFKALEANLDGLDGVKLYYLAGEVEIVSPISRDRERRKSTIGLLLEAYMREKSIRFYRRGGFTLEETGYSSGTPDESYCIGTDKAIPDIVIEIIISSGSTNKREIYKPKGVPEVWFWKSDRLLIYQFGASDYELVTRSRFFPELDPALLIGYLNHPDQYDAIAEFISEIRQAG